MKERSQLSSTHQRKSLGVSNKHQVSSQGYLYYFKKVSLRVSFTSRHVIPLRHRWRHINLIYILFHIPVGFFLLEAHPLHANLILSSAIASGFVPPISLVTFAFFSF
jgi:hypothetical protein